MSKLNLKQSLYELIDNEIDSENTNINIEWLTDYLIGHNVIVLSYKVGDIVYSIGYSTCHRGEDLPDSYMCSGCKDECDMKKIIKSRDAPSLSFIVENLIEHDNCYLTYAEAEKRLKESETK